jgi:hypothetical protein
MTKDYYLYEDPFIKALNPGTLPDYICDYIDEFDRTEINQIKGVILQFAIAEGLIVKSGDILAINATQDTGSWLWVLASVNFRSSVDVSQYEMVTSSLTSRLGNPINQILDLHMRLGCMFNHKVLNTVVNRVMSSVQLIPYDTKDVKSITWNDIHRKTPWYWLLILLQSTTRSSLDKIQYAG